MNYLSLNLIPINNLIYLCDVVDIPFIFRFRNALGKLRITLLIFKFSHIFPAQSIFTYFNNISHWAM